MTRLQLAERKLARFEKEFSEAVQAHMNHFKQTNGQPMNDKRNGGAFFKRADQIDQKASRLNKEIEAQKERVAMLKEHEFNLANGMNKNGTLATSVANLEEIKSRGGAYNCKRAKELELIVDKAQKDQEAMTDKTKAIIESGAVTKWEKKPMYYFVKGLRKVALMIDENGEFYISKHYPAKDEKDLQFVNNILGVIQCQNQNPKPRPTTTPKPTE